MPIQPQQESLTNTSHLHRCQSNDETIRNAPFPLTHLLHLYETGHGRDLYINNLEGFRLLVDWLSPITTPPSSSFKEIPKLHGSFALQQIRTILGFPYEDIYEEYTSWSLTKNKFPYSERR